MTDEPTTLASWTRALRKQGDALAALCSEVGLKPRLLAATRQSLALQHVRDPRCSIGERAYLLGFADTSSFSRALTRGTGQTPSHYRDGPKQP